MSRIVLAVAASSRFSGLFQTQFEAAARRLARYSLEWVKTLLPWAT